MPIIFHFYVKWNSIENKISAVLIDINNKFQFSDQRQHFVEFGKSFLVYRDIEIEFRMHIESQNLQLLLNVWKIY